MPDDDAIVFSPETFKAHDDAVTYIRSRIRTRDPLGRQKRFPRIIPGAWGKLAAGATITAASGLSLGSGSVKLCDREGTVADDAEDVDVANAGSVLTGGVGGAIVPLEWTDGEWSTCGCEGGSITQTFQLNGCSPYGLRSVSIYDSPGGSLLASGNTGIGGGITLTWSGPTTIWVQPTGTRLTGVSVTVVSGGTSTVNFGIASGYACFLDNSCIDPVKTTLHGSCTNGVTATLVLNPIGTAWADGVKSWFLNRIRQLTTAFPCGSDVNNNFTSTVCPDSGTVSLTYSVCGGTETVTITE